MRLIFGSALAVLALAWSGCGQAEAPNLEVPVRVSAPANASEVPLYGENTKGSASSEIWMKNAAGEIGVRNVTRPTLTPFLPDPAKATGTAVVVVPGGAFMALALDHEGTQVARALADQGIAAFVLKYRLLPTPQDDKLFVPYLRSKLMAGLTDPTKMPKLQNPDADADAAAALRLVRDNAAKWGVDPHRVGMIGFSAGAIASINTVLSAKAGEGPAFFGYIYGPQAAVPAPANAPPMFDAIAFDDPLFPTMGFPVAQSWHQAGQAVEVHAYQKGGHGFGLGVPGTTTTQVLQQFVAWLAMQGYLSKAAAH